MPNHETSTYSSTSVCGGTAGERAARLLGSRSPPTPCVPFAEEFQPYTKSKKQYRTMGSHPLHSYLATNRIHASGGNLVFCQPFISSMALARQTWHAARLKWRPKQSIAGSELPACDI